MFICLMVGFVGSKPWGRSRFGRGEREGDKYMHDLILNKYQVFLFIRIIAVYHPSTILNSSWKLHSKFHITRQFWIDVCSILRNLLYFHKSSSLLPFICKKNWIHNYTPYNRFESLHSCSVWYIQNCSFTWTADVHWDKKCSLLWILNQIFNLIVFS